MGRAKLEWRMGRISPFRSIASDQIEALSEAQFDGVRLEPLSPKSEIRDTQDGYSVESELAMLSEDQTRRHFF